MSTTLNQLGKNLAANTVRMRKDSSTNIKELAHITGVSARTLQRIEVAKKARQSYSPMLKTAIRLADAAGVTVDEFIKNRLVFQ
jgi:DNA-binding XRE family transcriptional regulator